MGSLSLAKNQSTWKEISANSHEGFSYVSGMSNVMERAAAAAEAVTHGAWMPEPAALQPDCKFVTVDIETGGFAATDEVIQLAAKCGDEEFSVFICPTKKFHPKATEATGFKLQNGQLFRRNRCIPTVPVAEACRKFLDFLSSCGDQIIIVGHNIIRFDFPRILKLLRQHGLAKEFLNLVFGMTDTMPLLKQGKMSKQEHLADKYLTADEWQPYIRGAHDALIDCKLLDGLLAHFKVTEAKLN
ncbi:uncharacterized protein LOC117643228 [Thrips palmi]|uniref:Uncharacterized protein LOC117643228 n=1 Tax=Thrips palmi TaxID=161013 RepID=A0A6P8YLB4_THRPL|nr:uncharacterized protein LOC117643228 [Thrips palmi]